MIWELNRRKFLVSSGATLALPFLESLLRPKLAQAESESVKRLCIVYSPNGVGSLGWFPSDGSSWNSSTLISLKRHAQKSFLLRGLYSRNGDPVAVNLLGSHSGGSSSFLTGARPLSAKESSSPKVGISIDNIVAREIAQSAFKTQIPALHLINYLGPEADANMPSIYTSTISWDAEDSPVIMDSDPIQIFEKIFSGSVGDSEVWRRNRFFRKSILDQVLSESKSLKNRLSFSDRARFEEYLASVRSIEGKLSDVTNQPRLMPTCEQAPGRPELVDKENQLYYKQKIGILFDMLAVSFQCDLTRVAVVMLGNEVSNMSYPFLATPDGKPILSGHHWMTHQATHVSSVAEISRYEVDLFASFLDRLDAIDEGGKTILDQSTVVFGSGIADGSHHTVEDLPFVVAGRGAGTIANGWFGKTTTLANRTPISNAWLGIAKLMMVNPPTRMGRYWLTEQSKYDETASDSTGIIDFT